jgi:dienelactone hydrolase
MTLDTKVVYDDAGKIAGLFFVPHKPAAAPAPPDDSDAESYREIEVVVGSDPWRLPGTLAVPRGEGSFPGLILVHGSGPHDRDETIGPNRPFRDLALGLATQGIVVLRYDKRTLAHGAALKSMGERLTLKEETVDDVIAAVDLLRRTDAVDSKRIYLLGHSLGGVALPRVARRSTDVAGLILVATPSRPLEDLILEQLDYLAALDGTVSAEERADGEVMAERVARVKDPQRLEGSEPADLPLGIGRVYWQDLARHRATTIAPSLSHRLLVLQGGRDYQVTRQDFDGWKATLAPHAAATFLFYPGLNHLLMEGDGPATPADYQTAGQVSRQLIDDIAAWILGRPGAARSTSRAAA